ncbi:MAG: AbrB/MazE/SpoVT family DNA-binding domain-containing protein [Clostridiales bacterium]|nr:AbrB/MazE/SpoVT family DNA-binding domain-containing protein [Clostridiales bacterium]
MKSTGIVRKVDSLGRVVLPIELRRTMGMDVKDPVEIFVQGDRIVLRKYQPACIFCGSEKDLVEHGDYMVCRSCIEALAQK